MMIKRQFDISRFYQFIKWAVIAVAVTFLIMSLDRFHASNKTYPIGTTLSAKDFADWNKASTDAQNYLILAIATPILFFGIVNVSRYIFPKKSD